MPTTWTGRVVSVMQADLTDLVTNYQAVTVAATNTTAAPGGSAPGDLSDTAVGGFYQLEDGSGDLLLESGTADRLVLEGTAFAYRNLSIRTTQNQDGSVTTYGSLETFEGGYAAGMTFNLTSTNFGKVAQPYTITNVMISFLHTTPLYLIEFGDAYQTLQSAGGGVLTQVGSQATIQQGSAVPAGTLGYAQVTANQTGITTAADLTGLTVTVTVGSGRRIRVSGQVGLQQITNAALQTLTIQEGATVLATALVNFAISDSRTTVIEVPLQPTAGVHTYKLTLASTAASGQLAASSTSASFILVEDIGI